MAEVIGIAGGVIAIADVIRELAIFLGEDPQVWHKRRAPALEHTQKTLQRLQLILDDLVLSMLDGNTQRLSWDGGFAFIDTALAENARDLDRLKEVVTKLKVDNSPLGAKRGAWKLYMNDEIRNINSNLEALCTTLSLAFSVSLMSGNWTTSRGAGLNTHTPEFVAPEDLRNDGLFESPATNERRVVDYPERLTSKQKRFFDRLNFDLQPSSWIHSSCTLYDAGDETWHIETQPFEHGLLEDLGIFESTITSGLEGSSELTLIVCEPPRSINTVPFNRDNFVDIMDKLCIPPALFQTLFTGTPKFEYYKPAHNAKTAGVVLRTPMSETEDWTLALSWVLGSPCVRGIVHGMQSADSARLAAYLRDTRATTTHPLNIPVALCEMLMESDSNGVKLHASDLYLVEVRTNYDAYPNLPTSPEQDFAKLTRSLNVIISRLAFHEMRVHANGVFIDEMRALNANIVAGHHAGAPPSDAAKEREKWSEKLGAMSQELLERLSHLKTEQRALLLEITCNQKIAEGQLNIVYNLVAQRDNKDSLEMAKTQTQESFAMRTIAVMSIFFLPGTFVSSFFSMDIFDWRAATVSSVISPRFWIYWAVTLPLTLTVCSIWFFWLQAHGKAEAQKVRPRGEMNARIKTNALDSINPGTFRWLKSQRSKLRNLGLKQGAEDPRPPPPSDIEIAAVRIRAPTLEVRRAPTMRQGPTR